MLINFICKFLIDLFFFCSQSVCRFNCKHFMTSVAKSSHLMFKIDLVL